MATQDVGAKLTHLLVEASVQFSQDIYRRTINTSPWLKLIKQSQWPDEMGDTISVLTYERTLPTTSNTWGGINSGSDTFAVPNATTVAVAQSIKTFSLSHTAIESQPIVVNDLRMGFRFREQIKAVYDNLVENVAWLWIKRYRDEFRRLSGSKIIAGLTAATSSGGVLIRSSGEFYADSDLSTNVPQYISMLTQSLLNKLYMELIRDGAGNRPMGMENGRPIFTLVCSPEASDALIRLNPAIRQDFRESSQVNELLKPLGVERSYKGFFHVIDTTCPRYNYVDTAPTTASVTATIEDFDSVNKVAKVTLTGTTALDFIFVGQYLKVTTTAGSVSGGYVIRKSADKGAGDFYITYTAITASTSATAPTYTGVNPRTKVEDASFTKRLVEVPFYVPDTSGYSTGSANNQGMSAAKRWVVNEAYYTAELEESFIVHPEVMESLIPAPITSAGSGTTFNPVNYRGDFKFLNIQHRTENPDGTWGYYRGVLASGSKPVKPQYGISIISKRIPEVGVLVADPLIDTAANVYVEGAGAAISVASK
jgi:hypothetical protein